MIYFLPTLYTEDTGDKSDELYVRVGKTSRPHASAEMWLWQQVVKVGFGLYKPVGNRFYDISLCYTRIYAKGKN